MKFLLAIIGGGGFAAAGAAAGMNWEAISAWVGVLGIWQRLEHRLTRIEDKLKIK